MKESLDITKIGKQYPSDQQIVEAWTHKMRRYQTMPTADLQFPTN